MKNERNYGLAMVLSIVLCALSAAGVFMLPEVTATAMSVLTVIFMVVFSMSFTKWLEVKFEG